MSAFKLYFDGTTIEMSFSDPEINKEYYSCWYPHEARELHTKLGHLLQDLEVEESA